uniref:Bidirectional sugar transporter SWEET n=1 Tax=Kalanchoe fedtschenkoi TaxID=63787 RepID=A0A7N0UGW6_KALFE
MFVSGNVISLLVFLSPIPTFIRIIRNRSTQHFESLPYICTLLSASLWTYYGLIKPGSFIVVPVNGFGVLTEIVYITIFLVYAPPARRLKTIALVVVMNLLLLAAAILVTHFMMGPSLRIDTVGILCAGLAIAMYGSPLAAMHRVVTTRSAEFLPLLVSLALFTNGGVWSLYSLLAGDYFIGIPNGIGFIFGAAQLALYAIYRSPEEEAPQTEHLLATPTDPEHQA